MQQTNVCSTGEFQKEIVNTKRSDGGAYGNNRNNAVRDYLSFSRITHPTVAHGEKEERESEGEFRQTENRDQGRVFLGVGAQAARYVTIAEDIRPWKSISLIPLRQR